MKLLILWTVLLPFSLQLSAQNSETISIGKKEVIFSKILSENRNIWIYTPDFTTPYANPDKRYPVLYLLDGDAHFYSTVGIVQQLSQANGNGVLPEMIIVAVENTNRLRDLVPSDDKNKMNPFVEFLSSELIPYVDKNYQTAPYKLLVGHSLGGLTAIDILTNSPDLFNAYIAIDPSMWFNNEKFLNNTISQLPAQNLKGKKLFIGTANTMPTGMSLEKLKSDTSIETQHIRSIFKLDEFLQENNNGLAYSQRYYEKERHITVPLLSEYDGLHAIFDYYFLDATEKDFTDTSALIASKLKSHYIQVSEKMGYKNAAPESLINYLAYDALFQKHYNKSKALFELNMEWYPNSSLVYDAMADYYLTKNDTIHAIANLEKSLKLKEDSTILSKLNSINGKNAANLPNDLQKYAGTYTLVDFQLDIILEVRNGKLWAIVPGQEDDEFQPISENTFTVRGKQGYTVTFQMKSNRPKAFTSVQPNGTFKAVYKGK